MLHALALGLLAAGCSPGKAVEGLDPGDPVLNPIVVSIDLRTARSRMGTDEALPITAKGRLNIGGEVNQPSDWQALDGGTITPVGDSSTALFSSSSTGTFRVVGKGKGKKIGQGGTGGSTDTTTTQPVDTVTVVVTPPPSPIVSVSVSPSAATVVMNTIQVFTATGTREDGTPANPIVTWSSSGGGTLNAVESAAEYKAGATTGTWQVTASLESGTASASAQVQVTDAWLVEDFSAYASTADLLSDPRGIYTNEDFTTSRISIDPNVAVPGGRQSMRYTYPDRSGDSSARCSDYTVGRNISFPASVREVWVELWVRFEPGFQTKAPTEWNCTSAAALKLMFLRVSGQTGRFGLSVGQFGHNFQTSVPGGEPDFLASMSPFPMFTDGQWYRIRYYATVNNGGAFKFWVNDTLVLNKTSADGIRSTADGIYGLALGRNLNQGPGKVQSLWWGKIQAWRTSPGW